MTQGAPIPSAGTTVHPSDSAAQRDAEPLMIAAIAEAIDVPLTKRRVELANGAWCEIDGVSEDERVLVEAYAHQGDVKGAQLKKVTEDAFKLVTLARTRPGSRLIIAFADDAAARKFLGRSWKAEALRTWGIEPLVVELDGEVRAGIQAAQVRQFR